MADYDQAEKISSDRTKDGYTDVWDRRTFMRGAGATSGLAAFGRLSASATAQDESRTGGRASPVDLGYYTQAQVDRIRADIDSGDGPRTSAFEILIDRARPDHLNRMPQAEKYFYYDNTEKENIDLLALDGEAAHDLALAYQLTGEKEYAEKAVTFLNDWSYNNFGLQANHPPRAEMKSAQILIAFIMGASLIRNYSGWNEDDRAQFEDWLQLYTPEWRYSKYLNNFKDRQVMGKIFAYQYLRNREAFDTAVDEFKDRLFTRVLPSGIPQEALNKAESKGGNFSLAYTHNVLQHWVNSARVTYNVARGGVGHNFDPFHYAPISDDGGRRGLKVALDATLPYFRDPETWPKKFGGSEQKEIRPADAHYRLPALYEAANMFYDDPNYEAYLQNLRPVDTTSEHRYFNWGTLTWGPELLEDTSFEVDVETYEPTIHATMSKAPSSVTINGRIDKHWEEAPVYSIDHVRTGLPQGDADISGQWRGLWNNHGLYYLVEVADRKLIADSGSTLFQDDAVEIYLSGDRTTTDRYDDHDFQYLFRYDGSTVQAGPNSAHKETAAIEQASIETDVGYQLEIAIPWETIGVDPSEGHLIGTDVYIDDDDDGGNGQETGLSWFERFAGISYRNPNHFGTAQLLGSNSDQGNRTVRESNSNAHLDRS